MNYSLVPSPPPGSRPTRGLYSGTGKGPCPLSPRICAPQPDRRGQDRENKTQGTSCINLLRQSGPGQSLFPRLFATAGRCRQSPTAPAQRPKYWLYKKQWENKPVSVLSHTVMPRREQTMKRRERGRAHRAELRRRHGWDRWDALLG